MSEAAEIRLKRLSMRAHRRGTREMDLILGAFADARLAALSAGEVDLFEALLGENDHDIYQWITAQATPPGRFGPILAAIAEGADAGLGP